MPLSTYPELSSGVVLCIDDNQNVLECEKAFLETFGYTVLTAPSGGKGLELASIHPVDVVIVDYFMPEMNGHEVAIEMRRLRPQAGIIMLSAAVDVPEQALRLVDAFIAKDRVASQLLPAIAQLHGCRSIPQPSCDA
jgi:two-component system, cell cycle sensor histidine kinase and response regulator CckA